jgi:hypothetical protein
MAAVLVEGQDYYFNEKGLMVFTEAYHRKRGYCCGSGCKHCPYTREEFIAARNRKRQQSLGLGN